MPCEVEFVGFTVSDHLVVGFGLDYGHYYRDLPYIAALDGDEGVEAG